jgi:hypothetical protein
MVFPNPSLTSTRDRTARKSKAVSLCAVWTLLIVQGFGLPALAQDSPDGSPEVLSPKARVVVTSDPTGQIITLDGHRQDATTPTELDLDPGRYFMTVNAEGYQPLNHELAVAAGEHVGLEFILLKTPPEPPTAEELRAMAPPFGADDPNSEYWADAKPRHLANDACLECHPSIMKLHSVGEHRTLSCEDCHSALSDHVKDDKVIGAMQVVRGAGIQGLCMTCHDRESKNRTREPSRTIILDRHLQELRVRPVNRCEDCHHVHDPQKWVHEAREMVGLPEMMASIPMMDEKLAVEKKQKYNSMTETFFVFPLAPGVLGMLASGDEGEFPSEALLVSGLVLIAGSYFLGQYFYSRELNRIRAINDERSAVNLRVKNHNQLVKEAMADHEKAVEIWVTESEGRGMVVIQGQ